jgi:hypothetical protein
VVAESLSLPVAPAGLSGYLAWLSGSRRSVVRRDWRDFAAAGFAFAREPPAQVLEEAVALIQAVKLRHHGADHPTLTKLRMRGWVAAADGQAVAFTVRSPGTDLVAVSFGVTYDRTLEMYEIGLSDGPGRHCAYAEAMVYSPLRFAAANGCERILLGIGSAHPKRLRGASPAPLWAVGDAG